MDCTEFTLTLEPSQDGTLNISFEDRRLLLGASIRLLGSRFAIGQPIFRDDLVRVASLADDGELIG
jgi:hypothetical protein